MLPAGLVLVPLPAGAWALLSVTVAVATKTLCECVTGWQLASLVSARGPSAAALGRSAAAVGHSALPLCRLAWVAFGPECGPPDRFAGSQAEASTLILAALSRRLPPAWLLLHVSLCRRVCLLPPLIPAFADAFACSLPALQPLPTRLLSSTTRPSTLIVAAF